MATFQFYSFIQNVATGNVLDVSGGNPLPLAQVIAYTQKTTASGQSNQLWALTDDGLIINKATGLVLNVAFADSSPGAQVITWPAAASGANQQWTFQNGLLVSGLGGNVLDIAGTEVGAAVVINPPSGAATQVWQIVPSNVFAPVMALAPVPFPAFVDADEATAFAYISEALVGGPDIRAQYTNANLSFSALDTQLGRLQRPSSIPSDAWMAVVTQLGAELGDLANASTLLGNLKSYFVDAGLEQTALVNSLISYASLSQSTPVPVLLGPLFQGLFTAVTALVTGGGTLQAVLSTIINIDAAEGALSTESFEVLAGGLGAALSASFSQAMTTLGQTFDTIFQDWGKLQAVNALILSTGPTSLNWSSTQVQAMAAASTAGYSVEVMKLLLPARYQIWTSYQVTQSAMAILTAGVPSNALWTPQVDEALYDVFIVTDGASYPSSQALDVVWNNGVSPSDFFLGRDGWGVSVVRQNFNDCGDLFINLTNNTRSTLTVTAAQAGAGKGSVVGSATRTLSAYAGTLLFIAQQGDFYGPDILLQVFDPSISTTDPVLVIQAQQNLCIGASAPAINVSGGTATNGYGFSATTVIGQTGGTEVPGTANITITRWPP